MNEICAQSQRPLRVLHCPWNVAGHPAALARAERRLGIHSHAVEIVANQYGFAADEVLFARSLHPLRQEARRWRLVLRAIRNFDVIHFNFGQSILTTKAYPGIKRVDRPSWWERLTGLYYRCTWMADLAVLKRLGKGIVMTYQGDDARQGDECRRRFPITAADFVDATYYSAGTDYWKRRAIAKVARYADRIYALNPDLLHVLPQHARFMPYANVDPRQWTPAHRDENPVPLVIHAPTHRGVKGSEFVFRAVERLRKEHIRFEFELIENLSHTEARTLYDRADLLVDQLLIGWYGGLAVELMALGKPVVCYLREDDLAFIPPAMRKDLPIIPASPHDIYEVLKRMLTVPRVELQKIGQRSRAFVEEWHDPIKVVQHVISDYHTITRKRRFSALFR
jgi:hypothetical protein